MTLYRLPKFINNFFYPPKVEERAYIEFPEKTDLTLNQLIDGHTTIVDEVNNLKESVSNLEKSNPQLEIEYVGIALGIVAIVIASIAFTKSKE